jgi:putative ABC transport system permease protein
VVYTAVDRVLLAPLPYQQPDDLYCVWRNYSWVPLERGWLARPDIAALKEAGGPVKDVVAMRNLGETLSRTGDGADPLQISVLSQTPHLFDALGVEPMLGRTFTPQESGSGRPPLLIRAGRRRTRPPARRNGGGPGRALSGRC